MTFWLPAGLAAASAAVLLAVPRPGGVRLAGLRAATARPVAAPLSLLVPVAAGVTLGLAAVPLAVATLVVAQRALADRRRRAERSSERRAALDALALLAAELRAGRPPADALTAAAGVAVGPVGRALAAAAATERMGGDVAAALEVDGSAVPEVLRALAACWEVCSSTGAGLATAVDRLSESLRAAEEHRRAIDAELAGPRATAALLAVLPVAGIGLAAALGAHPLHVLLHTPVGLVCLVAGLVLDAAGVLWTRRLVAGAMGDA